MRRIAEDDSVSARLKESYQGDPLERAYQPKAQTNETPEPPPVGSTTVVPNATDNSQNISNDNE
jgi:hypothetical protein